MTTRTILYAVPPGEEGRVLKRVQFISPVGLTRDPSSYYEVKIGIAEGEKIDYIGTFSSNEFALAAGEAFDVTGANNLSESIESGLVVVADMVLVGFPPNISGCICAVFVGHEVEQPSAAHGDVGDLGAKQAVRDVAEHVRLTGDGLDRIIVPLSIPPPTIPDSYAVPYMDRHDAGATYTLGTYVDGAVSITVVVPQGKKITVLVTGTWQVEGDAGPGTTNLFGAIGDGTTDYNDTEAYTAGAGENNPGSNTLAQDITVDTTYKLRFKVTGSAALVEDQTITALAVVSSA